jgi:sugar phosphate isomerase/epimerase
LLASHTVAYPNTSLERALAGIAQAGFKNVEIAAVPGFADHLIPEEMTNEDYEKVKQLLSKHNLELISIGAHLMVESAGTDLLQSASNRAIELTKNRIDLADRLGARWVTIAAGEAKNAEEKNTFYDNMKELGDYAKSRNVIIGLETHGGITATGKSCLEAMNAIMHEYVKINYDTANIRYFADESPEEDLDIIMLHVVHMHLKDIKGQSGSYEITPLGEGDVNFNKIFEITSKYGFTGPFSVEVELQQRQTTPIVINESTIDEGQKKSYDFLQQFELD